MPSGRSPMPICARRRSCNAGRCRRHSRPDCTSCRPIDSASRCIAHTRWRSTAGTGSISSPREASGQLATLDPQAPMIVPLTVRQYSHHLAASLVRHRGPVLLANLLLANFDGTWPGLVPDPGCRRPQHPARHSRGARECVKRGCKQANGRLPPTGPPQASASAGRNHLVTPVFHRRPIRPDRGACPRRAATRQCRVHDAEPAPPAGRHDR